MESLIEHLRATQGLVKVLGESPIFLKAIRQLPEVAKSEATVLITGETGTGKEFIARAIHYLSQRAAFPFIPVHCGLLPATRMGYEIFGQARGVFRGGPHSQARPLIVQAEKGTLFIDNLEALTLKAQRGALRLLQEKKLCAIKSSCEHQADVRIVAAALDQRVRAESFRAELYRRLSVFSIHLPPLRERQEDILVLSRHFLKKHASAGRPELRFAPEACEALLAYDWPGNVKELERAIIRGIHLNQTNLIQVKDLGIP